VKGSPNTFVLDFEAIKGRIERRGGWQAEDCEEMHLPAHCQGVRGPHSTDLAVIEVTKKGLVLKEVAPGLDSQRDSGPNRGQIDHSQRFERDRALVDELALLLLVLSIFLHTMISFKLDSNKRQSLPPGARIGD